MRTNILLDDALLAEARKVTTARTKKDIVHEALRELIKMRRRRSLLELRGKVKFARGYDHKKLRAAR